MQAHGMSTAAPETRYARSGDVHVAYQVFGEGDLDVVLVTGFVSHVERIWEHEPAARLLEGLASFAREGGDALEEPRGGLVLPDQLHEADEAGDQHDVEVAL